MTARIHVIHENEEWSKPLFEELERLGLPYSNWFVHEQQIDLASEPPEGLFYNRMSASSHTRDHRYSAELTGALIGWLESHSRRLINGSRALQLELSKAAQFSALRAQGIPSPRTVATVGKRIALEAAQRFSGRFIVKHNRGGKGLGVRLFDSPGAFERYLASEDYDHPVDGIMLIQDYIQSATPRITRLEFIGGQFLYAVDVDTQDGFELCPADTCQSSDELCPATPSAHERFRIDPSFNDPLIPRLVDFMDWNGIEVAAIELIEDREGQKFVYDVNTNTNYNRSAERVAGVSGMKTLADFLGRELGRLTAPSPEDASAARLIGRPA